MSMSESMMLPEVAASRDRAFIVEDHPAVSAMLAFWVGACGLQVLECDPHNLNQLDQARASDIVVVDLCLGDQDGIEVFRRLSACGFRGRIIVISAFPQNVIDVARQVGVDFGLNIVGALRKPFSPGNLRELVTAAAPSILHDGPPGDDLPPLREILEAGSLRFYYQPIVDVNTEAIHAIELLARGPTRTGRLGSMAAVLADATDGDLLDLSRIALRQAGQLRSLLRPQYPDIAISVNVPGNLLCTDALEEEMPAIRSGSPIDNAIVLEISERDAFHDLRIARRAATRAVLHGLSLSLDDFGTFNSNFDRFAQLPFCELKLDRAYVSGCAGDGFRQLICRIGIEVAHARGATVVAEGVEDPADLETLRRLGADYFQGYLIARPMNLEALVAWLDGHSSRCAPRPRRPRRSAFALDEG
ncbi:EAL domain-containing response regulator [Prosthecodimorpha staleyi]|uniref:EAL domain-containing response regulator n=1 Tax=Prosthecodimorpha staleyi TaxID=2840188 RepID=A0A947CZY2_9HYPH|nr:EAL domain-containing response regulator [Prosthecodimorpha staleyi]MBT9288390.1 EAL domain-containing response regulator [Prosthecodimorpha staleyi]